MKKYFLLSLLGVLSSTAFLSNLQSIYNGDRDRPKPVIIINLPGHPVPLPNPPKPTRLFLLSDFYPIE